MAAGPPRPPALGKSGKADWAQLASGEWIRGELTRLHDEKLYFDSSEFDDVEIDWSDVESLILVGKMSVMLADRIVVIGTFDMRNGAVKLVTAKETLRLTRSDIHGIQRGEGNELSLWSGGASFGLSARSGNTEQMDMTIKANLMRFTNLTRFRINYLGEISSVNKDTTANSHRVPAQFDVFLTDRLYLTVPAIEYFTDEFSNIQNRFSAGVGLGYEAIDISWLNWDVNAGVGYQGTDFVSRFDGGTGVDHDAAVILGTSINFDFPRGIEWDNSFQAQIVVTDFDKTSQHAESVLSFDIWGPLEFELSFIFDRIRRPQERADGTTPKSNDYRLTAGLGFDF